MVESNPLGRTLLGKSIPPGDSTMKTLWFRFVDDATKLPTFIGIASAPSMVELFWEIDQYGDPFAVEVCEVKRGGSFCVGLKRVKAQGEVFMAPKPTTLELSESTPTEPTERVWSAPKWPRNVYGTRTSTPLKA